MSLLVCWVVFPVVLCAIALGCGLLLERVTGEKLHGALLIPLGVAVMIVLGQLTLGFDDLVDLARPVVLVAAVAGFAVGWGSLRDHLSRLDHWAVSTVALVVLIFGAPVILSGEATFSGYIMLDDTATFSGLADHYFAAGRDFSGLDPSTFEATVQINLSQGYPMGSMIPIGMASPLVGQDLLWIYQPYLSLMAGLMALCMYTMISPLVVTPWRRFVIAVIAASPSILFAYAQQGGVKELVAAFMLAVVPASVAPLLREPGTARSVVPGAVALAAFVSVLGLGGGAWAAPALILTALVAVFLRRGIENVRLQITQVGMFAAVGGLLVGLTLSDAGFVQGDVTDVLTNSEDKGNLIEPLSKAQLFGVWPGADYRLDLGDGAPLAYVLIALMAALAVAGVGYALWRRRFDVALYPVAGAIALLAISIPAGIWVDGKALATAAPAFVLMSLLGTAWISRVGVPVVAIGATVAIAGGIYYSNYQTFEYVSLAPRDRLHEAEEMAGLVENEGPTMDNEYDPYVARHLMRDADPEGPSELRRRNVYLNDGRFLLKGAVADLDLFQLGAILNYRTILLPKNPAASRPPGNYRLVKEGEFFELWQRPAGPPESDILKRLPAGDYAHAAGLLDCKQILAFARQARAGSTLRLRAAFRPENTILEPLQLQNRPASWLPDGFDNRRVLPTGQGTANGQITVPSGGRWEVWLGGSFARGFEVRIDGRKVGEARGEMANLGQYVKLGTMEPTPGAHRVEIERLGKGFFSPGKGQRPINVLLEGLGPLSLTPADGKTSVITITPAQARARLCDNPRLDWVELVKPGASVASPETPTPQPPPVPADPSAPAAPPGTTAK